MVGYGYVIRLLDRVFFFFSFFRVLFLLGRLGALACSLLCWSQLKEQEGHTDVKNVIGIHNSIGVLMMTSGSAEDRNIPEGPPHAAGTIPASSDFINLPNITNLIGSDDMISS